MHAQRAANQQADGIAHGGAQHHGRAHTAAKRHGYAQPCHAAEYRDQYAQQGMLGNAAGNVARSGGRQDQQRVDQQHAHPADGEHDGHGHQDDKGVFHPFDSDAAALRQLRVDGGEQQLVLIARALAQQSDILIMDEPTSALDYGNQLRVMQRVRALARQGYTILLSSHNPQQALLFSDRILALHDGVICADGAPEKVITPELLETLYSIKTRLAEAEEGRLIIPLLKEDD